MVRAHETGGAGALHAAARPAKTTVILRAPPIRFEFSCLLPLRQISQ